MGRVQGRRGGDVGEEFSVGDGGQGGLQMPVIFLLPHILSPLIPVRPPAPPSPLPPPPPYPPPLPPSPRPSLHPKPPTCDHL